ncbi:MAG: hypothetical protein LUH15_12015 [Tannerellaceae bacterium]|nr:hypothetical protein [Tannerellaceae bacterium]
MAFYNNLPFRVSSVSDPYNILTPADKTALENFQFSSPDLFDGRNFNFDLELAESTAAKDGKEVHVTFTFPPQYNIPDRTIAFEAYHLQPNSYIVKPGGSIHIPIRKAFRAWSQYPMNSRLPDGTLGCEVLWDDMGGLITDITLTPAHTQDKIDSEIFVRTNPDKTEGNVVVALTVDGTVVWSWHLWIIDYNPEQNTYTYANGGTTEFMRYDLGALDNNPTYKYESEGFYYQWGRKDPFPPTDELNDPQSRPFTDHHWVENFPGSISSFSTAPRPNWSNSQEAWKYTITNPLTYITTQAEPHNWDYANNSLWTLFDSNQKTYKTEFDPCPEGWRVPQTQHPWGNETKFFNPVPSQNNFGSAFGYTRTDGYYMPATGYIDNEGNYTHIGQEAATYTAWITNQGQGNYTSYLSVSFVPGNSSYGYTSGRKSSALNIRCSRPK